MRNALKENASPTTLIKKMTHLTLQSYLNKLMGQRRISTDALAELAGLNRASLYKIMNGSTKHPQRNVVLRLALVLRLSFEETQELLSRSRNANLSGNSARDIILSHGIIQQRSIDEVNQRLAAHDFPDLFSKE